MSSVVLIFLILYYAVVVGIGFWAVRKGGAKDMEGYLLGGRQVGPLVTALTLQSTSMSGYMFLGAGSAGYTTGYWAIWYAAGDIGGGVVNLSIIGRRMRKFSKIFGSLTSIEYLENRYPHAATRLIAGILSVFFLYFYVLAQFIAGGKGMALVTGLPYWVALTIAVAIIMIYTFLGGYFAVAYTDFFQSLVMVIGVVWILIATLNAVGGWAEANAQLAELDPTYLSIWGKDLQYQGQWGEVAGAVLIFSVGYMGWPHVVTRHLAMTNPQTARLAGMYSTLWNLLFVTSPYIVGIMAILILPNLGDPEMAIFSVAGKLLPGAVTGIVMAAIMAAIMSTADSILLQVGTIASRDIFYRFIKPDASDKHMVWVSRILILVMGAIGFVIALLQPPGVFDIVVFTTSVLGSAFLPSYVCAVWWKKANTPGAISSMVGGALTAFLWDSSGLAAATTTHPMLAGLVISFILMIVVSLATQKSSPVKENIIKAMDEAAKLGPIPKGMIASMDTNLTSESKGVSDSLNGNK
ncbi:MAG: sodium/proline symporter [Spirochaetales bacterium]|nr:sodium/proline symporter [Spirochaetales bacterium]MCF7938646.1 sodium/proline symporter [Spirochaetales bacterium]